MSLWRNRLARSAVNRKVGGSSPPRDAFFFGKSCVIQNGKIEIYWLEESEKKRERKDMSPT